MSGRHRAPRRGALVYAGALAVPALSLSLLAAPASADVNDTWEEAVACESGGAWDATNPSSGAHGPLQLLPSTYAAFGPGSVYDASKAQYMEAADDVYRVQGWDAWVCLDADPGVPPSVGWGGWSGSGSSNASTDVDAGVKASAGGGYEPPCTEAKLYWEVCDPADLDASADVSAGSGSVSVGVDLDGDGDGDYRGVSKPRYFLYETADPANRGEWVSP